MCVERRNGLTETTGTEKNGRIPRKISKRAQQMSEDLETVWRDQQQFQWERNGLMKSYLKADDTWQRLQALKLFVT
jgi:hypothetical protein